MKKIILIISIAFMIGCSRNVKEVKENAEQVFEQAGFKVVGYHGYQLRLITGGLVWYSLERIPPNGIFYQAAICKWFGEYHIYNIEAVDAIKPE